MPLSPRIVILAITTERHGEGGRLDRHSFNQNNLGDINMLKMRASISWLISSRIKCICFFFKPCYFGLKSAFPYLDLLNPNRPRRYGDYSLSISLCPLLLSLPPSRSCKIFLNFAESPLCHVLFGVLLLRWIMDYGFQFRADLVTYSSFFRRVCPIHFHFLDLFGGFFYCWFVPLQRFLFDVFWPPNAN